MPGAETIAINSPPTTESSLEPWHSTLKQQLKLTIPALCNILTHGFLTPLVMNIAMKQTKQFTWIEASPFLGNMQRIPLLLALGPIFTQVRFINRYLGEGHQFEQDGNTTEANRSYQQIGLFFHSVHPLNLLYSATISTVFFFQSQAITENLFKQDTAISELVGQYFWGYAPGLFFQIQLNNISQALYNTNQLIAAGTLSIWQMSSEIVLALALTFGYAPLHIPALGLFGYGLAQTIQSSISCLFGSLYVQWKHHKDSPFKRYGLNLSFKKLFTFDHCEALIQVGGFSGLQLATDSFGILITTAMMGSIGDQARESLGILQASLLWGAIILWQINLAMIRSMEKLLATQVGKMNEIFIQNNGLETPVSHDLLKAIKKTLLYSSLLTCVTTIALTIPLLFFSIPMVSVFYTQLTNDTTTIFQWIIAGAATIPLIGQGVAALRGIFAETFSGFLFCVLGSILTNGTTVMFCKETYKNTDVVIGFFTGFLTAGLLIEARLLYRLYYATPKTLERNEKTVPPGKITHFLKRIGLISSDGSNNGLRTPLTQAAYNHS